MKCPICKDDNCTGFKHMLKSDPHYERLRDPRNKQIEQLEAENRTLKIHNAQLIAMFDDWHKAFWNDLARALERARKRPVDN